MKSLYEVTIHILTNDDGLTKFEVQGIKELMIKTKDEVEDEENEDGD